MYYYLQPKDLIKSGDEYNHPPANGVHWSYCNSSIGYTCEEYSKRTDCPRQWRVRRKIKTTKLGNDL